MNLSEIELKRNYLKTDIGMESSLQNQIHSKTTNMNLESIKVPFTSETIIFHSIQNQLYNYIMEII